MKQSSQLPSGLGSALALNKGVVSLARMAAISPFLLRHIESPYCNRNIRVKPESPVHTKTQLIELTVSLTCPIASSQNLGIHVASRHPSPPSSSKHLCINDTNNEFCSAYLSAFTPVSFHPGKKTGVRHLAISDIYWQWIQYWAIHPDPKRPSEGRREPGEIETIYLVITGGCNLIWSVTLDNDEDFGDRGRCGWRLERDIAQSGDDIRSLRGIENFLGHMRRRLGMPSRG